MAVYALPFYDIQVAMIKRLKANTGLQAIGVGVYDTVDENTPYPYITVSEPTAAPIDTKTSNCEEMNYTIHVWRQDNSDFSGKKIVYEILSLCQQVLAPRNYAINGIIVLDVVRMNASVFDDITPGLKHGVLQLRFKIKNDI